MCFVLFLVLGVGSSTEACQSVEESTEQIVGDQGQSTQEQVNTLRRQPTKFLRLLSDEFGNPLALQTATTKYALKNDDGEVDFEVYLESVIHIADSSYYRGFQKRFERYDAVLYELVSDQAQQRPKDDDLPSGMQLLQQISAGTLGLAYQLEEVDYGAKNMIHADLSQSEMAKRLADRGETGTTLLVDLFAHIVKQVGETQVTEDDDSETENDTEDQPAGKKIDLKLLTDPDGIMKIRRIMASTLVDSQLLDSSFPPSLHRLIIGDRNDRVMSVMNKQKANGKSRVAVFYGAGHMADFEKRLVGEYGMELVDINWRNAWDLRDGAIEGGPLEGLIESAFRDSFKEKMRRFAKGRNSEKGNDDTESQKDERLKSMEETLKALEAKLKQLENESNQGNKESEGSGDSGGTSNRS